MKMKKDSKYPRQITCKLPVVFLLETISHDGYFQYMVAIFTSLLPPMKLWWRNTNLLYFRGKLVSISKKFGKLLKKAHNTYIRWRSKWRWGWGVGSGEWGRRWEGWEHKREIYLCSDYFAIFQISPSHHKSAFAF